MKFFTSIVLSVSIFMLQALPTAAFPAFPGIPNFQKKPVSSPDQPPAQDEPNETVQTNPSGAGAVSLSFDDGLLSTYTEALPILTENGFRGTAYVYPQAQVEEFLEGFMNWEEVRSLQNDYGWEIGSHAYSHPHLTQIPKREMRRNIRTAVREFKREGIDAQGFASPYGEYNDEVLTYVSKFHIYHRNAFGGTFNELQSQNDYNLNAVEVSYDMTPNQVKALIDEAISGNKWLILYWHDLVSGNPSPFNYNIDDFREIIQYLAEQNTWVAPVSEIVKGWGNGENLVENGDFEIGRGRDADGWIRNHRSKVKVIRRFQGNAPLPRRSVLIKGDPAQIQISSQPISIDGGQKYILRMFSRMANLTGGSGNVWISEFDDDGTYIGGQWLGGFFGASVETRYFEYTPQVGAESIELYFYAEAGSNLKWHIDDVQMRQM